MNRLFLFLSISFLSFFLISCNMYNSKMYPLGYASRVELINGLDSLYTIDNLMSHFPKSYYEYCLRDKEWWSEYEMCPSYIIEEDTIYSHLSTNAYFVEKKTKVFIDSLINHSSFSDIIPYSSDRIFHVKISNIKDSEPYTRKYNLVSSNVDTTRSPIPDFEFASFGLGEVNDDTLGYAYFNDTLLLMGERTILPDDLTVYVLESKNGDFWKIKNMEPRPVLPTLWKHGFSRGYAISSSLNIVCYWMMAW